MALVALAWPSPCSPDTEELQAALREHGVAGIEDVRLAVLEVDGEISVVPKRGTVHRMRRRPVRGLRTQ